MRVCVRACVRIGVQSCVCVRVRASVACVRVHVYIAGMSCESLVAVCTIECVCQLALAITLLKAGV